MTGVLRPAASSISRRIAARLRLTLLCSAAAIVAGSAVAQAETIDYGSFEQLFGEPITTSVTGTPQRARSVPANMEIVTQQDIERSGARDIPTILSHVLGVDVLQWSNNDYDVGIRGYDQATSSRLLVLVNGRQVYQDTYGFTAWSAIPVELSEIRQIEIVKGPASALFGFNAASGVINIVTYSPLYDNVKSASLSTGTQSLTQGSIVGTAHVGDRFGIRMSGGGFTSDDFSSVRNGLNALGQTQRNERGSVSADSVLKLTDDSQLGLEATHVAYNGVTVNPALVFAYSRYAVDSLKGSYSVETPLGHIQADAYTNVSDVVIEPQNTPPFPAIFHNRVTVAQAQDLFKLGADHTFRVSLEYRKNGMDTIQAAGQPSGSVSYDVASVGGMWNWRLRPDLEVTNAVRIDQLWLNRTGNFPASGLAQTNADWDQTFRKVSFNSGVVYEAGTDDTLRLMVGRGLQMPNLLSLGGFNTVYAAPPLNQALVSNPRLNPAVVMSYEVDWDHKLREMGAVVRTALFYETVDAVGNTALFSPPNNVIVQQGSIGDSREIGLEISAKGNFLENWNWSAGYAPRIVYDGLTVPSSISGVSYSQMTPVHVLNASLGWTRGPWQVDTFARWQSGTNGYAFAGTAFTPVRIDSYVSLDARLGYKVTDNLTLAVAGQQLGMDSQQQTALGSVDRRIYATVSVHY
jgi:outer membrane receptor for ferrienterochelin and colicins